MPLGAGGGGGTRAVDSGWLSCPLILALPLLIILLEPQFPHLPNGNDDVCFTGSWREMCVRPGA